MKKANLFLGLTFNCFLSFGQAENRSGIFLTIRCGANIPKYDVVLSSKVVCLTSDPILTSSEFGQVTEIREIKGKVFFDMKLSSKATQTLRKLAANLPNSSLTIVVNDRVISVFKASEIKMGGSIRFIGSIRYRDAIILAHRSLQDHVALEKGQ